MILCSLKEAPVVKTERRAAAEVWFMLLSPSGRKEVKNELSDMILVGSVGWLVDRSSVGWLVSRFNSWEAKVSLSFTFDIFDENKWYRCSFLPSDCSWGNCVECREFWFCSEHLYCHIVSGGVIVNITSVISPLYLVQPASVTLLNYKPNYLSQASIPSTRRESCHSSKWSQLLSADDTNKSHLHLS